MTTTNRSFVVGVFQEEAQAQQAMNDLMGAGFSKDQIRVCPKMRPPSTMVSLSQAVLLW